MILASQWLKIANYQLRVGIASAKTPAFEIMDSSVLLAVIIRAITMPIDSSLWRG